jgi:hypothetical protein
MNYQTPKDYLICIVKGIDRLFDGRGIVQPTTVRNGNAIYSVDDFWLIKMRAFLLARFRASTADQKTLRTIAQVGPGQA